MEIMKRIGIVLTSIFFLTGCSFFTHSTTAPATTAPISTTMTSSSSTTPTPSATSASLFIPALLIYEVYGGGGNVGATYRNDYVVLYNPSAASFDLSHCSLQYSAAGGTSFYVFPLEGTVAAESFFVITLYGGTNGSPLPVSFGPSVSLNLAAASGKLALVLGNEPISGPADEFVLDFLGYGTSATLFEGAPTANLGNVASAKRTSFSDTDDNATDFTIGIPDLAYVLDAMEMTGIVLSGWDDVYAVGDSLNLSGALILGTFAEGATARILPTPEMISGFDTSEPGSFTLTVSYLTFTTDFPYSVIDIDPDSLVVISFVDIGMAGGGPGEATLIECGDWDILVDSGENSPEATNELLKFLNDHVTDGVIEYLIATHQDADHIGGFTEVMDAFQVPHAVLYSTPASIATSLRRTFENRLTTEGTSVVRIRTLVDSGDPTIPLLDGVLLRFYDTGFLEGTTANSSSIVFVVEAYGTRVLLTGDAESNQEAVYAPLVGDVDVFKMGHHGTANGTSSTFLETVKPEIAIVSNGDVLGNEYNHPTYTAVGRIYAYSSEVPVYAVTGGNGKAVGIPITWQRNGTITLSITSAGYSVASEYFGAHPMELSQTDYWQDDSNPNKDKGYVAPTAWMPSETSVVWLEFQRSDRSQEDKIRAQ